MNENFKQRLANIKCFIFDVDGVLTNGSLFVMPSELIRVMNIRDGYALHEAVKARYKVCIISGGKSESVRTRLNNLGVTDIHLGIDNKREKLDEIMEDYDLQFDEILYMGDALPDYEIMKLIGVPTCPEDAAPEIRELSIYISSFKGGDGCVRDVIEQVMRLHGKWPFQNTVQDSGAKN
ncbi:MAG: HAD-IIIA family hydrolase [Bacteroidetes bacterium]|nr:HAD-IIIA family hydrolase [Bacteroidota bacterium]